MSAANKALIRNYVQKWNSKPVDPNGLSKLLHPDFLDHDVTYPTSNPDTRDRAQFIKAFTEFLDACPDAKLTNAQGEEITDNDMVAEGDKVVLHLMFTGTYNMKGPVLGLSSLARSRQIEVRGVVLYRILENQIKESWAYSDDLGAMRQLGVIVVEP